MDEFNSGPAELVFVVPITGTIRRLPTHVVIQPPEGGIKVESAVLCDALRSVSRQRLVKKWGRVTPATLGVVEDRVRILLGL